METPMRVDCFPFGVGYSGVDGRLRDLFTEFTDLSSSDEKSPSRTKARLTALAAAADSLGLTGRSVFTGLRILAAGLRDELLDTRQFSLFYRFVFFLSRETGQKSLAVGSAIEGWKLTLSGRFRLLDQWCAYVMVHHRFSISEDTWKQVLEFSMIVHEDLSNYDPEGAWPVLIDEFVEYMYNQMYQRDVCQFGMCAVGLPRLGLHHCEESSDPLFLSCMGGSCLCDDCSSGRNICGNTEPSLPGMAASAGSKRRRKDSKEEAAQAEHVNIIAQKLAEMPSPTKDFSMGCNGDELRKKMKLDPFSRLALRRVESPKRAQELIMSAWCGRPGWAGCLAEAGISLMSFDDRDIISDHPMDLAGGGVVAHGVS